MQIAAILSLSEDLPNPGSSSASQVKLGYSGFSSYARLDILGQSLLDRAITKLKQFGVSCYSVVSESSPQWTPSRVATIDRWQPAIATYVQERVDVLLLVRMNAYCDLDFVQFLRFHLESESPITQAYAADGALDIALVDASQLRGAGGASRKALSALTSKPGRFLYHGYVNRLVRPQDFYQLVDDGLRGQCGLRPIGNEKQEWVWQGADSKIDDSATIMGPAFIGKGSSIGACCTVGAGTSIERDCQVDCGTVVEESWITRNTYLGVALDVRRSIVGQNTLFHLDRNVEVEVGDRRLIGAAAKSAPVLAGLGSRFRRAEPKREIESSRCVNL